MSSDATIAGYLRRNDRDRWEIVGHDGGVYELTSGSVCEIQVAGHWIRTRLEYCPGSVVAVAGDRLPACGSDAVHPGHYYALGRGQAVVRVPRQNPSTSHNLSRFNGLAIPGAGCSEPGLGTCLHRARRPAVRGPAGARDGSARLVILSHRASDKIPAIPPDKSRHSESKRQ